jgi:hypothetical protein
VAEWELSVDVTVSPDEAWALVGDPTSVPRWFPKYVDASVDGSTRTLRRDDGGELVEALRERDEARRYYSYSVLRGAPVASHEASFEVREAPGGCSIVWWTKTEPKDPDMDMEARLRPAQTDGLERMKALLEGTPDAA